MLPTRHDDDDYSVVGIIEGTEVEPSFWQLVHDHQLQLSKEFKHDFPIEKDPKKTNE